MAKPAHYRGSYHVQARHIREAAKADPTTRCWRCGRMAHEHPLHRNGKRGWWEAGHIHTGNPNSPLAPEWSTCNRSHGARVGNARLRQKRTPRHTSRRW